MPNKFEHGKGDPNNYSNGDPRRQHVRNINYKAKTEDRSKPQCLQEVNSPPKRPTTITLPLACCDDEPLTKIPK